MQTLHTVIAVTMLVAVAYFFACFIAGIFERRATMHDVIKNSYAAAGLALAALYVLHW